MVWYPHDTDDTMSLSSFGVSTVAGEMLCRSSDIVHLGAGRSGESEEGLGTLSSGTTLTVVLAAWLTNENSYEKSILWKVGSKVKLFLILK